MTFRYFAYGSNMWMPRMVARCPSARVVGITHLDGWRRVYDKPSVDGSAKLNIRPHPEGRTPGVVYSVDQVERGRLDAAEPLYTPVLTPAGLVYAYTGAPMAELPFPWYVELVEIGARSHGLEPPLAPARRRSA